MLLVRPAWDDDCMKLHVYMPIMLFSGINLSWTMLPPLTCYMLSELVHVFF